jgi:hypothetical protein
MAWMEKQLESLTELVKELTREREHQSLSRTGAYKGILKKKETLRCPLDYQSILSDDVISCSKRIQSRIK